MKRRPWTTSLTGGSFALILSVSAVGNLATGFDLDIAVMAALFLWCAIFSLVSAVALRFRYGGAALAVLSVAAAPLFWKEGLLWDQLQSLFFAISSHFHIVYDWPVIGSPAAEDMSLPLIVLAAWAAFSVNWSFCRHKTVLPVIPPVILPAVVCMVTTDTVPDGIYLYLLIFGMALLLLTDWTRRNYPTQGVRLTLRMAIPVAAALALLFMANPREEYVSHAGKYQQEIVSWFQGMQDRFSINGGGSFAAGVSRELNLKYVGPKGSDSRPVMVVNAPVDGTLYLRGRDYDVYSGTGWDSTKDRREEFISGGSSAGTLTIETHGVRDVLYVPYYTAQEITMTGGALENDDDLRRYSYDFSLSAYGTYSIDSRYTDLPADTRRWANGLDIIQVAASSSYSEKIRLIEDYVRQSAAYDLGTPRMTAGSDDFARWFLENCDTGYCVHFATAATVLLRAAGIPARYVEGYMVTARAGEDTVVLARNAHAWAEYYSEGVWRILEATPVDPGAEEDPTMGTTPGETEPTPAATEEPTPEDDTAPAPETQPMGGDEGPGMTPGQPTGRPIQMPDWLKTVFGVMLAAALVLIQSRIRIGWKRRQWDRGNPNEKAVVRWRQTRRIARLLKEPFPDELERLAEKAVFSQHRIGSDELLRFKDYRGALLAAVRGRPWYQRILLRLVFAIDVTT